MAEIKKPEAYFGTIVRNRDKNDFRANDNYFKHISSVGGEAEIQQESAGSKDHRELSHDIIEQQLCEAGVDNWLLYMENDNLHKALIALPRKDVELLYLLFVVRLQQTEIAQLYGVSQGAIGWRLNRLKKIISGFLENAL